MFLNKAKAPPAMQRPILASKAARKSAPSTSQQASSPIPPISPKPAKRLYAEVDGSLQSPKKVVKLSGEDRIQKLEAQIRELHKFILDSNIAHQAPPSIIEQFEGIEGYEQILSHSLKERIRATWEPLYEETLLGKKSSVTADNVSQAVCKYIPEIERLSRRPKGLRLSLDLVIYLAQHSYGDPEYIGYGEGKRPSDVPADKLLVSILKRIKAQDETFMAEEEFQELRSEKRRMKIHGIENHFARSLALIWTWNKPQNVPKGVNGLHA